jgi:hypothetical protein
MKPVSVIMARSVLLFDFAEFNSQGLNLWPIYEWLAKKYQFASSPKHVLDVNSDKALSFQAGSFVNSKRQNILVTLAIYSNGLSAEASSSTDDSDEFLQEATVAVSKEFGFTVPSNAGRAYVSQLDVEMQFSLDAVNPRLAKLASMLSSLVKPIDGKRRDFDFGALNLWTEDMNLATSPAYFRFERKIGLPFSSNRYFSQAALKTDEHLQFLADFESALGRN